MVKIPRADPGYLGLHSGDVMKGRYLKSIKQMMMNSQKKKVGSKYRSLVRLQVKVTICRTGRQKNTK